MGLVVGETRALHASPQSLLEVLLGELRLAFSIAFDSFRGASFVAVVGPLIGHQRRAVVVAERATAFDPYSAVDSAESHRPCCAVAGRTAEGYLL